MLNNIIVLFSVLFSDAEELQRSKDVCGLGYKHWFQNEMGNVLIDEGIRIASKARVKRAALKVTTFIRFALANARVARMRSTRNRPQVPSPPQHNQHHAPHAHTRTDTQHTHTHTQVVAQIKRRVLYERVNTRGKAGRPAKRKRNGGRKKKPVQQQVGMSCIPPPIVIPHSHHTFIQVVTQRIMSTISPTLKHYLDSLAFVDFTPSFVPRRRGRKKSVMKKLSEGTMCACYPYP